MMNILDTFTENVLAIQEATIVNYAEFSPAVMSGTSIVCSISGNSSVQILKNHGSVRIVELLLWPWGKLVTLRSFCIKQVEAASKMERSSVIFSPNYVIRCIELMNKSGSIWRNL